MSSVLPVSGPIALPVRTPDLTPRDWLEAGQSLLRRGGLRALKLRPLAEELRVSTGSFYHHFRDFDDYQGKLATYFAEDQVSDLIAALERATADPIGRIRLLGQTVRRRGASRIAVAMRAWAESDPRARSAVERHDELMLDFLARSLMQTGFSRAEAEVRAYGLITLGLSKVHAPHLDMASLFDSLLDIMVAVPARS
ncbi:TetR/AcrR family transcriptional regulator [Sphingomonas radiodurans]|uniref:TetR/AcrR family transcriptional regulator n=1 Tax=Sphingomonas radiodurans TaxID=2890321 RepID=UPI001E3E53B6|nr:TetR/AcrR family transcriptional regulator [Sphingomonas radiodurans]WBH16437.1 TetR/AcrR family transcriptional regulator [Sphingomonas radiodurans]